MTKTLPRTLVWLMLSLPPVAYAQRPNACADLTGFKIQGVGMVITKAQLVPARAAAEPAQPGRPRFTGPLPEYCRADGIIDRRTGVDGKQYGIGFGLALPANWNRGFPMQGGGGLNGSVQMPLGAQAAGSTPGLARGFAVVSTDTGHTGTEAFDGSFRKDQQANLDFAYVAVGRVAEAANQIIAQYYGLPAEHSYYAGCSTGGREAMLMTQRYPMYFDGVVSGAPAVRTGLSNLADRWVAVSFNQIAPKHTDGKPIPGGAFSDGDRKLIVNTILKQCDARDGLRGGMIFDTVGCDFDPAILAPALSPEARTRQVLDMFYARQFEAIYALTTPEMKNAISLETYKSQAEQILSLGTPKSASEPAARASGGLTVVTITLQWPSVTLDFGVSWNSAGQIAGTWFTRPPAANWQPPDYAKPDAFTERSFTVGDDDWKLPGSLTLPKGKGPLPAVVLVHGSGPNDRDETVMGAKVFRDLAQGLSSRGIVVLRYDKRTLVYPSQCAADPHFTMNQETVEDAARAVALLREDPAVNPGRVFVLGHSQGGYMMPRIAKRAPKLAGAIILAGNVRSLQELIDSQMAYLKGDPAVAAKLLKSLPPGYLADLAGYDPASEAKRIDLPLLILQGERDYQVTMQDFSLWKAALGARKNVTFRSYPALNHLFIAGEGKSTPAEYQKAGHVDGAVIEDIANWILTGPSATR